MITTSVDISGCWAFSWASTQWVWVKARWLPRVPMRMVRGNEPPTQFSLEGEDGTGDEAPIVDELFQERGRDVEGKIADDLDASAVGVGRLLETEPEHIVDDEGDVLYASLKEATSEELCQARVLFYSDHVPHRLRKGKSQRPHSRADFYDPGVRVKSGASNDLADDGRIPEKMLPQFLCGSERVCSFHRSSSGQSFFFRTRSR